MAENLIGAQIHRQWCQSALGGRVASLENMFFGFDTKLCCFKLNEDTS
jgi:hypothetical protein